MALASVVNMGNPSMLKTPAPQVQTAEAHTVLTTQGDTLEGVPLWNGIELSTTSEISLISEIATSSAKAKDPALNGAPKKKTVARLAVSSAAVEKAVETYFADIPIMVRIAKCESQFRQIDTQTGDVLRGRVNSADRGVMQINEMYHGATAKKLGLNLLTLEGNMAYARYLYEAQGTQPWMSSASCWSAPQADTIAKS